MEFSLGLGREDKVFEERSGMELFERDKQFLTCRKT
jgi:hypothetical protein